MKIIAVILLFLCTAAHAQNPQDKEVDVVYKSIISHIELIQSVKYKGEIKIQHSKPFLTKNALKQNPWIRTIKCRMSGRKYYYEVKTSDSPWQKTGDGEKIVCAYDGKKFQLYIDKIRTLSWRQAQPKSNIDLLECDLLLKPFNGFALESDEEYPIILNLDSLTSQEFWTKLKSKSPIYDNAKGLITIKGIQNFNTKGVLVIKMNKEMFPEEYSYSVENENGTQGHLIYRCRVLKYEKKVVKTGIFTYPSTFEVELNDEKTGENIYKGVAAITEIEINQEIPDYEFEINPNIAKAIWDADEKVFIKAR